MSSLDRARRAAQQIDLNVEELLDAIADDPSIGDRSMGRSGRILGEVVIRDLENTAAAVRAVLDQ